MKNCGSKTKHTCAEKNYATCIEYELEVPTFSNLTGQDCVSVEETIDDTYDILTGVKSEINLSELGQDCINYGITPKIVKNVLLRYEQEICDLKAKVEVLETTAICNINITDCGLTLPDNPCGGTFSTLGELLGYLLDNITPTTP